MVRQQESDQTRPDRRTISTQVTPRRRQFSSSRLEPFRLVVARFDTAAIAHALRDEGRSCRRARRTDRESFRPVAGPIAARPAACWGLARKTSRPENFPAFGKRRMAHAVQIPTAAPSNPIRAPQTRRLPVRQRVASRAASVFNSIQPREGGRRRLFQSSNCAAAAAPHRACQRSTSQAGCE